MKCNEYLKSELLKTVALVILGISCAIYLSGCNINTNSIVDYGNYKYNFTLEIPKAFSENIEIVEEENIIYFVNKEIRTKNSDEILGIVGRIEIFEKEKFTKDDLEQKHDSYNLIFLGENVDYYFGWSHATDVQFPLNASQKLKDEHTAMEKEFDEIIKTFRISLS